jgi:nucleotide-binding universal stress UspA family protein
MKNIVVAVDFSKGSMHALRYALYIAGRAQSDLTLVWVDNQQTQTGLAAIPVNDMRSEAKTRLDEIIRKHKKKFKGKITYKLRKGKVFSEIRNTALALGANLIIAGTHGGSGYEKYWIGSNAYRIVTHAPCPVVSVKFITATKPLISRIVMPIDNSAETLQKIAITADLAALFKAEVHVLTLLTDKLRSLRLRTEANGYQAMKQLTAKGVNTVFSSLETTSITEALIDYTVNINADLISIMTEQEATGTGALLGPNARLVINQSPVPVLSSHPNQTFLP